MILFSDPSFISNLLWAVVSIALGVCSTLSAMDLAIYLLPFDALIGLLCLVALGFGSRFSASAATRPTPSVARRSISMPRDGGGASVLPTSVSTTSSTSSTSISTRFQSKPPLLGPKAFLSVAHSIALGVYAICCVAKPGAATSLAFPCLPAVMQLFICLMQLPVRLQILPMVAATAAPLVAFRSEFLHPLPIILLAVALMYSILTATATPSMGLEEPSGPSLSGHSIQMPDSQLPARTCSWDPSTNSQGHSLVSHREGGGISGITDYGIAPSRVSFEFGISADLSVTPSKSQRTSEEYRAANRVSPKTSWFQLPSFLKPKSRPQYPHRNNFHLVTPNPHIPRPSDLSEGFPPVRELTTDCLFGSKGAGRGQTLSWDEVSPSKTGSGQLPNISFSEGFPHSLITIRSPTKQNGEDSAIPASGSNPLESEFSRPTTIESAIHPVDADSCGVSSQFPDREATKSCLLPQMIQPTLLFDSSMENLRGTGSLGTPSAGLVGTRETTPALAPTLPTSILLDDLNRGLPSTNINDRESSSFLPSFGVGIPATISAQRLSAIMLNCRHPSPSNRVTRTSAVSPSNPLAPATRRNSRCLENAAFGEFTQSNESVNSPKKSSGVEVTCEATAEQELPEGHLGVQELKLKYDLLQDQLTEAIAGKKKAEEGLLEQCLQVKQIREQLDEANIQHVRSQKEHGEQLKLKYESSLKPLAMVSPILPGASDCVTPRAIDPWKASPVDASIYRTPKFEVMAEQLQRATEDKQKVDEELVAQLLELRNARQQLDDANIRLVKNQIQASEDLAQQRVTSNEIRLKYDLLKVSYDERVAMCKKMEIHLNELVAKLAETKKLYDHLKARPGQTVHEGSGEGLVQEIQKCHAMKVKCDDLKAIVEYESRETLKTQGALEELREQTRDAHQMYSEMKSKCDRQKELISQQNAQLAAASTSIKVLRWMIPPKSTELSDLPSWDEPSGPLRIPSETGSEHSVSTEINNSNNNANQFQPLFADLSHDMRTPLTTALVALEILMDHKRAKLEETDRNDLLQKTWSALQNVLILVNNVLDASKLSNSGGIQPVPKQINIRRMAAQVLRTMEVQANQGKVELILHACSELPTFVSIDRMIVQRILTNLVANALKFTPQHGTVSLRLGYDSQRQFLLGLVTDTGMGMDPDVQASLFTRFYQAAHGKGGTGLGLTICQQLISELGGSISAFSEGKGRGSTFQFEISAPFVKTIHRPLDCFALVKMDDCQLRRDAVIEMLRYAGVKVLPHTSEQLTSTIKPDIVFVSTDCETEIAKWREEDTYVCSIVPNCGTKCASNEVAGTLRSPIDIAELRQFLNMTAATTEEGHENSETSSVLSAATTVLRPTLELPGAHPLVETASSPIDESRMREVRALLVEDNAINHSLFLRNLKNAGITQVESAYNGLEAVDIAEKSRFTVIIMDCEMPECDGFEATRRIREFPHHRGTLIVAMTADRSASQMDKCRRAGMDEFFAKPVLAQTWQTIANLAVRKLMATEATAATP